MVSSKCCQVVSPSPLRFLAALMPPCAQTECERFTGTIENRSTLPPCSAILMTADKPASPPPTTMILGFVAIGVALLLRLCRLLRLHLLDLAGMLFVRGLALKAIAETINSRKPYAADHKEKAEAHHKET